MKPMFKILTAASLLLLGLHVPAWAGVDDDVARLQQQWEKVKYARAAKEQAPAFEALLKEANKVVEQNPARAEPLVWNAIIEASLAGAKGGLGALGHVKSAKKNLEQSIELNAKALDGSAYTSLGSLYYQVPGWPISFGDNKKAAEFLAKGLAINPDGIDSNYFNGDFLFRSGDMAGAEKYLKKALLAPARPSRKGADEGRRQEILQLLEKINAKK